MIQLYDKLPPDFCGGSIISCDSGEYCKTWDAQRLLNPVMAKIRFLRGHVPDATQRAWSNYKLPPELRGGMIRSCGVSYCNALDAQRLLNRARAEIEFLREHIPDVEATPEERARHKPVKC